MTERTIILFSASHEPLGECSVLGGACSSIRLNERGERLIGLTMRRLSSNDVCQTMPFSEALREWADHSGILIVSFLSNRVSVWHQIASLPLTEFDRYMLAFAISHASERQQEVWSEALGTEIERQKTLH